MRPAAAVKAANPVISPSTIRRNARATRTLSDPESHQRTNASRTNMSNNDVSDGIDIIDCFVEQHHPMDILTAVINQLDRKFSDLKAENDELKDAVVNLNADREALKEDIEASKSSSVNAVQSSMTPVADENVGKLQNFANESGIDKTEDMDVPAKTVSTDDIGRYSLLRNSAEDMRLYTKCEESFPRSAFVPDPVKMKKNIRRQMLTAIDVGEYYHTHGPLMIFRDIASSPRFEVATSFAIALNAIWISIDVDANGTKTLQEKDVTFQIVEFGFFAYFVLEWLIRFLAYRRTLDSLKDKWFLFDSLLIVFNIVDLSLPAILSLFGVSQSAPGGKASLLRLVRLVKILKMARVAKLLRKWPELTILIKGMLIATRSVASTLVLLFVLVYVFALIFRQVTDGKAVGATYFSSVPHGVKTLMIASALPDLQDLIDDLGKESMLLAAFSVIYFVVASLTLMNMLVGVMVEIIGVVSAVEREAMRVMFVKSQLMQSLQESGVVVSMDMHLSRDDFQIFMMRPPVVKAIRAVGVDPFLILEYSDYIFEGGFHDFDGGFLTFTQLIEVVLELGGSNPATVKDLSDVRKTVIARVKLVEELLQSHSQTMHNYFQVLLQREQAVTNSHRRANSPSSCNDKHGFACRAVAKDETTAGVVAGLSLKSDDCGDDSATFGEAGQELCGARQEANRFLL